MAKMLLTEEENTAIARKLHELRTTAGFTQGECADFIGITSQQYGKYERLPHPKAEVSLRAAFMLCELFKVPFEAILPDIMRKRLPNMDKFAHGKNLDLMREFAKMPPHVQDEAIVMLRQFVTHKLGPKS